MGLFGKKKATPVREECGPAPAPLSAPLALEEVLRSLQECIARLDGGQLRAETVDVTVHLFDFGYLDSFKSAELLAFVQQRYRVNVPEVQLVTRLCTLEALARHICTQSGQAG